MCGCEVQQLFPHLRGGEEVVRIGLVACSRSSGAEPTKQPPEAGFRHVPWYVVQYPGSAHLTLIRPVGKKKGGVSKLNSLPHTVIHVIFVFNNERSECMGLPPLHPRPFLVLSHDASSVIQAGVEAQHCRTRTAIFVHFLEKNGVLVFVSGLLTTQYI